VLPARIKEVHYFDLNLGRGANWYRAQFPLRSDIGSGPQARLTGEASPYYLFHPHGPERIHRLLPSVKLIAVLRDPAARAFSHYGHNVRAGRESRPFERALEEEDSMIAVELAKMLEDERYESYDFQHYSYKARGIYADQLARYLAKFGPGQLLVLRSEDLFRRPQEILDETLAFLGLSSIKIPVFEQRNRGSYAATDALTRTMLQEYYRPHNVRLASLLGRDMHWD
jgi:hypothetical protein